MDLCKLQSNKAKHVAFSLQKLQASSFTSDCASSLSWWGNRRSNPPPWISIDSPRMDPAIAEHSMCQPGRPC